MINRIYGMLLFTTIIGIFFLFTGTTFGQLAGDYYIPQGDHDAGFETLEAAINALNDEGANGVVTFYIDGDLDERENTLQVSREDLTEATQLIIKPAPGKTPTITVTAHQTGGVATGVGISYASWVTIDGSNVENGESRDLTIAIDDDNVGIGIYVTGYAENVMIKNITLSYISDGPISEGIRMRRDGTTSNIPSDVLIENSLVGSEDRPFTSAVVAWGESQDNPLTNIQVVNNEVYARWRGITCFWNENNEYRNNIVNMLGTAVSGWYSGIYIPGWMNSSIVGNEIIIWGIANETAAQMSGILLNTTRERINIYNNTIATKEDFHYKDGVTDHRIFGILSHREGHESSVYNIFHNSIRIGNTGQTGRQAPIGWDEGVTVNNSTYNIENNILVVESDAASAYGIHWNVTQTDDGAIHSDHNNIYAPNANVGFWINEAKEDLDAWQTASNRDENSVSVPVAFYSDVNLRLAEDNADLITPNAIPLVWYDIDNKERDPSGVYMGAHEYIEIVTLYPVTFYVDMTDADPFDPETDDVVIAGNIWDPEWQQPGTNPNLVMEPHEAYPYIYWITLDLAAGDYEYKFFRVIDGAPSWDHGEWPGDPNRTVEITDAAHLYHEWDALEYDAMPMVMARDILPLGSLVTIEGVITRAFGDFTRLQDHTAGYVVRSSGDREWNDDVETGFLRDGDRVRLTGITSQFASLQQINNDDLQEYTRLERDQPLPDPIELTLAEIAENGRKYQSMLLFVNELEIDTDHTTFAAATTYSIKDPTVDFGEVDLRTGNPQDTFYDDEDIISPFSFTGVLGQFSFDDPNAGFQLMPIAEGDIDVVVSVDRRDSGLPAVYQLDQNYPNPFNPTTTIQFALPEQSQVTLEIYNMLGQRVRTLVAGEMYEAGYYSVVWDARNTSGSVVSSGLYIYRITAGDFTDVKRMMFLK